MTNSLGIIDNYFSLSEIKRKNELELNDPVNLDQAATEGPGFIDFCKTFGKVTNETIVFYLAFPLSNYLITNFEFKLYADSKPEYPHRSMTLMYNKNGYLLSLYPYEYSLKVLNKEAKFEDLVKRVKSNLESAPNGKDLFKDLMDSMDK